MTDTDLDALVRRLREFPDEARGEIWYGILDDSRKAANAIDTLRADLKARHAEMVAMAEVIASATNREVAAREENERTRHKALTEARQACISRRAQTSAGNQTWHAVQDCIDAIERLRDGG